MASLKTDSPLCRRIVRSFLDFLNSVEPAPGVDLEGLEVAKECLAEVFKIDPSSVDNRAKSDLLINVFNSWEANEKQEHKSDLSKKQEHKSDLTHEASLADAPSTSSAEIASDANHSEASQTLGEDWTREAHTLGASGDELFGQFFGALEKIHYFIPMSDGHDDQVQLDRATHLFHNAAMEMKKSGCQIFDVRNLAETFKSQGNRAMQSKLYSDAIELYTFAIALCADNAVYYCNRAAAYTQVHQYAEAVRDCLKSIEMKPSYSKAYSRLGFAYYAQGNYRDAIDEGFLKALELDPNNDSVKENIRVAEQKLKEEQRRSEHHQNSSSGSYQESNQQSAGGSRSHAVPPPFTSMPFNANGLPADIASMFRNMAGNAFQGQHPQHRQEADGNTDTADEPEIRVGGNVHVNFGEQMPEELTGALRSVMEMFQGASSSSVNRQDNVNGRSAPS
ncbi:Small glutamine-rich tetratricopeptide repeat-containing protein beta [Camellia lanceoleosa]|uniref:Small glutamine-rich tetratricopeptide repeat-containing protein beta n=1 Tax=Camellia lanceoleosa TaxID=1840588 RepID=A0ACC0GMM1_9ERIC|nr:Small glutamine-rich tetratricopeptide repeat-containing protein beta [Camellia lanceoleosa]